MSIYPPFQIGILNTWICTVLIFFIPTVISKVTANNGWQRAHTLPKMSTVEQVIYFNWLGVNILIYIYSIFTPFTAHSIYFYIGILVFVCGVVIMGMATWTYQTGSKEKLVTNGIYMVSRNPGYFGCFCAYIGMGLMGDSWPIIVLSLIHLGMYQVVACYEERMCYELYPDDFSHYKANVKKNFMFF